MRTNAQRLEEDLSCENTSNPFQINIDKFYKLRNSPKGKKKRRRNGNFCASSWIMSWRLVLEKSNSSSQEIWS
jgi:hypothetical protein